MNPRRICVVVSARASYARVKTALHAMKEHSCIELKLVVAASALLDRYGEVSGFIERDGFRIDHRAFTVLEGKNLLTAAKSTGLGLVELAGVFDRLTPDAVVTIADRHETMATAIAASYMNIPLVHIQGGEITGSIDEKVRHAVTKLADIHLVASEKARERVIGLGEDPDRVFFTGCPSVDIALSVRDRHLDFDVFEKYGGVGVRFDMSGKYIVVLQHPNTDEHDQAQMQIESTLKAVTRLRTPAFYFWPNADPGSDYLSKGIRIFRERNSGIPVHFFRNMTPEDFLKLIKHSACLVGNSSTGIREASFLGVPVVNIGTRQAGRDRAPNVMDVGYDSAAIADAVSTQCGHGPYPSSTLYGDGCAGERMAKILAEIKLQSTKQLRVSDYESV